MKECNSIAKHKKNLRKKKENLTLDVTVQWTFFLVEVNNKRRNWRQSIETNSQPLHTYTEKVSFTFSHAQRQKCTPAKFPINHSGPKRFQFLLFSFYCRMRENSLFLLLLLMSLVFALSLHSCVVVVNRVVIVRALTNDHAKYVSGQCAWVHMVYIWWSIDRIQTTSDCVHPARRVCMCTIRYRYPHSSELTHMHADTLNTEQWINRSNSGHAKANYEFYVFRLHLTRYYVHPNIKLVSHQLIMEQRRNYRFYTKRYHFWFCLIILYFY